MNLPRVERGLFYFQRMALAAAFGLAVLLAGCDPQDVVRWSPDGAHAIVCGSDGIYLVDGTGKIVGSAPDAWAWMPDSRHVIAVRQVEARNWAQVASLLGEERTQAVARAGGELAALLRGYHGDWDKFFSAPDVERWIDSLKKIGPGYTDSPLESWNLPFVYLHENDAESLAPFLATISKEEEKKQALAILRPRVFELLVKSAFPEKPPSERVLLRTVDSIETVCPSPNGKEIAVVVEEPVRPGLYVIPTDGGDRVPVDSGASEANWTPDGQWLTYAKTTLSYDTLSNQMLLGTITRCKVCDREGRLLSKTENPQDLAGVLFSKGKNSVACLPDGRILFSGTELGFPTPRNGAGKFKLFTVRPGPMPKIEQVVADEEAQRLPDRIDFFSLSPDGRHVAIPGGDGEVAIVSIESGKVQKIQGKIEMPDKNHRANQKENLDSVVPSWRSATEFSYVRPGKSGAVPKRAEVVLRSLDGASRVISATWTDAMTDSFLVRPKGMTAEALRDARGATGAKPE